MSVAELMFEKFDRDRSGSIDAKEFQALCYNLGYMLTDAEIKFALLSLDANGSGKIERGEFQKWWGGADRWTRLFLDETALRQRQAAANVFRRFDPTGTGSIRNLSFEALHETLSEFGLTTKSVEQCRKDLDTNRDGCIQFKEYIEWLGRQYDWASKIPGARPEPEKKDNLQVVVHRPRGLSQPNLQNIDPIPSRKILMVVNHFVISTTGFINKFLSHCEQKLRKVTIDIQRLEILLRILEGKIDSIDWLEKDAGGPPPSSQSNPADASAPDAGGGGVPPPPPAGGAGGVPPPPPGAGAPGAPPAPAGAEAKAAPAPAADAGPSLKDHPKTVKFFRMLNFGVPKAVIAQAMRREGLSESLLDLDPNAPAGPHLADGGASAAGAAGGAPPAPPAAAGGVPPAPPAAAAGVPPAPPAAAAGGVPPAPPAAAGGAPPAPPAPAAGGVPPAPPAAAGGAPPAPPAPAAAAPPKQPFDLSKALVSVKNVASDSDDDSSDFEEP